ncbi:hypothetical protein [Phycicoccus sp.]|uniref:hypothetical protein n=1 Tax=Phycicoccus sp. TaxID=1902410 RepID=UPI002CC264EC|nr:hypothetical protein [Phycicoccus sp.]HMM95369.1 hypothetical protein [Phycicoccus sp.]
MVQINDPAENNARLVAALLQFDDTYPTRYQTSPEFRAAIDHMAGLAPDLLRLAAERADRGAAMREQLLRGSYHVGPSAAFPGFPQS